MEEVPRLAEAFGLTLLQYRSQARLSQRELARRIGSSATYIHCVECGEKMPTIKTWYLLCQALDVDPHEFLTDYLQSQTRLSHKPE